MTAKFAHAVAAASNKKNTGHSLIFRKSDFITGSNPTEIFVSRDN